MLRQSALCHGLLVVIVASGCTFYFPNSVPVVTVQSFLEDDEVYPDATTAYLQTIGEATLHAPPEEVYERLLDISADMREGMPSGVFLLVDHSLSQARPGKWGVGSAVQMKQGHQSLVAAIESCNRPHLITAKILRTSKDQSARATLKYELKEQYSEETILTVTEYANTSNNTFSTWLSDRARERSMKEALTHFVKHFGGEVVRAEAQTNQAAAPSN